MTVEELIKELEKLPLDYDVMVWDCGLDTAGHPQIIVYETVVEIRGWKKAE